MKIKDSTKHVAYKTTLILMQEERKVTLSALDTAIQAGEHKEVRFPDGCLENLRELRRCVFEMKPPKTE
jgi:hypothetical protein